MKILRHNNFLKNYKKRILPNKNLDKEFEKRLSLFLQNPRISILRDHKLVGSKRGFRAFSVTGDIRVIYQIEKNCLMLYDIGTHNQVY